MLAGEALSYFPACSVAVAGGLTTGIPDRRPWLTANHHGQTARAPPSSKFEFPLPKHQLITTKRIRVGSCLPTSASGGDVLMPPAPPLPFTNKRIRRGAHRSVAQREAAIREFIDTHNSDPKPFVWVKSADEIVASISRTSGTGD
jgi:hypothetical protein